MDENFYTLYKIDGCDKMTYVTKGKILALIYTMIRMING